MPAFKRFLAIKRGTFSLFFPELCGFGQPLSGEIAAPRSLLASIPFCTGYAVEAARIAAE